jgi:polar amino acid transport system substrate-binding protein
MKQLIQNFKTGEMYVEEIPLPALSPGMVLVANEFSLISAGTERGTVKVARAGLIGKAKERPDLVIQVLNNIRKEGLSSTITKVKTRLDTLKALGYSSAGKVIASLDKNGIFKPGDRVACGGQNYASHAEIISVPQNLVVKIPENVSSEEAAFTTLGSIAIQGIRQSGALLGEKICVIGLGLLGQITCRLLKANGCMVSGIDLNEDYVEMAKKSGVLALNRNNPDLSSTCREITSGYGFDSVIITAAAHSNDPVELASKLARKKGKIVIVGSVKMDIQREPYFYQKELELLMSCSYGPGRYDPVYEEGGTDYPYPYVRWTEQRNMEAFLQVLSMNNVDLKPLITHVFDIEKANEAYDIVLGKIKEFSAGILLRYNPSEESGKTLFTTGNPKTGKINCGFIGAGNFAQSYLIPGVKSYGASLTGVVTSRGITSKNAADKFGFSFCSSDASDILGNKEINTVFIVTPHSSHAGLVIRALESGKNIFVEKPLAINDDQLEAVINAKKRYGMPLMVGFNRRFAPLTQRIRQEFEKVTEPIVINIRVNAGMVPREHWIQDPQTGAGRIIGEACHFIDLMQYLVNSEPVSVFAESIDTANTSIMPNDNFSAIIKFSNGSVGSLTYLANGDKKMPKERIEISGAGVSAVINDYKDGYIFRKEKQIKLKSPGKGHSEEIKIFLDSISSGSNIPLDFRSICLTTATTFRILDSISIGLPQKISL